MADPARALIKPVKNRDPGAAAQHIFSEKTPEKARTAGNEDFFLVKVDHKL